MARGKKSGKRALEGLPKAWVLAKISFFAASGLSK
jgi:hypothetical protein